MLKNESQADASLYEYIKKQIAVLSEHVNTSCSKLERRIGDLRRETDVSSFHNKLHKKAEREDVETALTSHDMRLKNTETDAKTALITIEKLENFLENIAMAVS